MKINNHIPPTGAFARLASGFGLVWFGLVWFGF
jgi:hypothetical protein